MTISRAADAAAWGIRDAESRLFKAATHSTDLASAFTDMSQAKLQLQASAVVLKTQQEMDRSLLDILA